jgi:uncharacterized membrane protein
MKDYVAVGLAVVAGAALFEAALVPGVVIGGAAILAPKLWPSLRRNLRPLLNATTARPKAPSAPTASKGALTPFVAPSRLGVKRAIAKTITFRIIVTALDFSVNYIVLGELGTAAGLSAFALVAGPVFYFAHETAWNYFGGTSVETPIRLRLLRNSEAGSDEGRGLTISRALAKTITFRTVASTVEFTATYVVVGDLVTAAGLSAAGLIFGPFVYYGHEWLWDRYAPPQETGEAPPVLLLAPPDPREAPLPA